MDKCSNKKSKRSNSKFKILNELVYGKTDGAYFTIIVESYRSARAGPHGYLHIRPIAGQRFPSTLHVECSKKMLTNYPVGTKFRIKVKLTDRLGEGEFLYSYYGWPFDVIS